MFRCSWSPLLHPLSFSLVHLGPGSLRPTIHDVRRFAPLDITFVRARMYRFSLLFRSGVGLSQFSIHSLASLVLMVRNPRPPPVTCFLPLATTAPGPGEDHQGPKATKNSRLDSFTTLEAWVDEKSTKQRKSPRTSGSLWKASGGFRGPPKIP